MNFIEVVTTISVVVTVLVFVGTTAGWAIKRWFKDQFSNNVAQLLPKLVNDDTSVARYAHQARDAATEAKDAALDARDSANAVKEVAYDIRDQLAAIKRQHHTYPVNADKAEDV